MTGSGMVELVSYRDSDWPAATPMYDVHTVGRYHGTNCVDRENFSARADSSSSLRNTMYCKIFHRGFDCMGGPETRATLTQQVKTDAPLSLMSESRLPQEIIDCILDLLHEEPKTLK